MSGLENDRREQKRFSIQAEALVNKDNTAGDNRFSCLTRDISSKGVCLATRQKVKPGTSVRLQLKIPIHLDELIPDQTTIITGLRAVGTVIWNSDSGIGVSFNNLCRIVPSV